MNVLSAVMTAAPRRDSSVQSRCIASTLGAGFSPLAIYAEPDVDFEQWVLDHPAISVIWRAHRYGEWQNWTHAILDGIRRNSRCGAILSLQDDILWSRNVRALADRLMWPSERCGIIHLYTSRRYGGIHPKGELSQLQPDRVPKMAAACGLLFRTAAAVDIAEYGISHGWRGATSGVKDTPYEKEGLDTFIGETAAALGWEVWLCNPSLGFHIGEESTLGHGQSLGGRQAAGWPGENANALELIR